MLSSDLNVAPASPLQRTNEFMNIKSMSFALASLRLMKDDLESQLRKLSVGKRTHADKPIATTRSRLDRPQVLCQLTSEQNNKLYAEFMDEDKLRMSAYKEMLGEQEHARGFYDQTMPPGLISKEITPFEWQVLEKIIMVCLYYKKEMPMATLQQMLFQRDPRLECTFQLQFGSLNQFVKRHGRVFFIHRGSKNPEVSLKIDFVRQLLLSRNGMNGSGEENADMLIDEKLEKEIVRLAIQILFSHTQENCTIGKLGQILHRRMNNPRLPRMFKATYGGLKKFFERQNTIFQIKKDHLYNPIITLNQDFRNLVEDQMAKENQPVLEKLSSPVNEDKRSPCHSLKEEKPTVDWSASLEQAQQEVFQVLAKDDQSWKNVPRQFA